MTRYRPIHTSGVTGPVSEYATLACLWIIQQADPTGWEWEQVTQ